MKPHDDISLAQWSLIEEWRAGKWKTLDLCRESGFHGWYGIESPGRAQIDKAIRLLKTHL
jgi:hypothetical protein